MLSETIGERNLHRRPQALEQAAGYIEQFWRGLGLSPRRLPFDVERRTCANLDVTIPGALDDCVLVGAHYDSVMESPGANDNGSGVAALLELARMLKDHRGRRSIRLAAFVNEEPPFFETPHMGSEVYAQACRARDERIVGMLCLETMGCYHAAEGSQDYPPLLKLVFPSRGNFIAVVGNFRSAWLVNRVVRGVLEVSRFPIEGIATFASVPGVDWSDHASFWRAGYPAVMLTDTAPYRFHQYHTKFDTIDTVDFASLAELTRALGHVVATLSVAEPPTPEEETPPQQRLPG